MFRSGLHHFQECGQREGRRVRPSLHSKTGRALASAKASKLARIEPMLRNDLPCDRTAGYPDYLSRELREQFNIVETNAVSSNDYDMHVLELIERHSTGLVLDCGAGRRSVYFDNVINFDVVPYDTTDVCGVGEELPFRDASFDAVISIAVLEHVKDPFRCAREIARVLKPGGNLICSVPFLQPYHGYPHHYYNMTHQGLTNLFEGMLNVNRIEVYGSVLPIWSLTWIVRSWAEGLSGATREEFLNLRLKDLMSEAQSFRNRSFVTELSHKKNLELASACVLFAHK
jgi:SAM-dependent methyltransferase